MEATEMNLNEIDLDIPPPTEGNEFITAYYQHLIMMAHFKKIRRKTGLLSFTIGFFIGLLIALIFVGF